MNPQVIDIYHRTTSKLDDTVYHITAQEVMYKAWTLERILGKSVVGRWTPAQYEQVVALVETCTTDAQRLLQIDWPAMVQGIQTGQQQIRNIGPSLFIDDSRITSSSQSASVTVTKEQSLYAEAT